jgi:ankyrin repeat protein
LQKMGWNELHTLAINNDASEIKESVLLRGTIVRERTELTGMMPIHKACMYGRLLAFQELLEMGENDIA